LNTGADRPRALRVGARQHRGSGISEPCHRERDRAGQGAQIFGDPREAVVLAPACRDEQSLDEVRRLGRDRQPHIELSALELECDCGRGAVGFDCADAHRPPKLRPDLSGDALDSLRGYGLEEGRENRVFASFRRSRRRSDPPRVVGLVPGRRPDHQQNQKTGTERQAAHALTRRE
jgi:hypothetical protein